MRLIHRQSIRSGQACKVRRCGPVSKLTRSSSAHLHACSPERAPVPDSEAREASSAVEPLAASMSNRSCWSSFAAYRSHTPYAPGSLTVKW